MLNISGVSIFLAGFLLLTNLFGLTNIKEPIIAAFIMTFFGLSVVFFSYKFGRGVVMLSGMVFAVGVALFVVEEYEILSAHNVFLPTLFFSFGTGFIALFTENKKELRLLFIALALYFIGFLSVAVFRDYRFVEIINITGMFFVKFWPGILLIAALAVFIKQRG